MGPYNNYFADLSSLVLQIMKAIDGVKRIDSYGLLILLYLGTHCNMAPANKLGDA